MLYSLYSLVSPCWQRWIIGSVCRLSLSEWLCVSGYCVCNFSQIIISMKKEKIIQCLYFKIISGHILASPTSPKVDFTSQRTGGLVSG